MKDNSDFIVKGYCFGTMEDAQIAKQEEKKIEYLEQHMDYGKPENMLLVYQKAIESKIFRTPVGWEYLRKLQQELNEYEELKDKIPPITMYTVFAHRVGDEIRVPVPRIPQKKKNTLKNKLVISVLLNLLMTAAVIGMFAIALTSDHPNILNYENALVNKYATWEQELTEKENEIRQRERELMEQE